ncbi:hypothetical protein [Granulicella rosea]|uniref:hypothetical protein n=1 Tax=Granulicella rosea TaxID=474952 RepID=UPI00115C9322|nr:hypothetical protein [Granulicella rosea]
MPVDYAEVIAELEAEEGRLKTSLAAIQAAKPALLLLWQKQNGSPDPQTPVTIMPRGRFAGMGATKAIPLLLQGQEVPMTYREIHDALKAEGWTSNSSDPAATVSATLSQLRGEVVVKIGDGWMLAAPVQLPPPPPPIYIPRPPGFNSPSDYGITDDDDDDSFESNSPENEW